MSTAAQNSIILRAKISEEEWAEIRKEAIDRGVTNGEFVAQLIRAGRECLPPLEGETNAQR